MTIQIKGFVSSAMYLVLGLISYMMIGEYTIFTWTDPWLYVYMVFWPFIWLWIFLFWFAIIAALCLIIYGVVEWYHNQRLASVRKNLRRKIK